MKHDHLALGGVSQLHQHDLCKGMQFHMVAVYRKQNAASITTLS